MGILHSIVIQKLVMSAWMFASMLVVFTWWKFPIKWPMTVKWLAILVLGITSLFTLWAWGHSAFQVSHDLVYAVSQVAWNLYKIVVLTLLWIICLFIFPGISRYLGSGKKGQAYSRLRQKLKIDSDKLPVFFTKLWFKIVASSLGLGALGFFLFSSNPMGVKAMPHIFGIEFIPTHGFPFSAQVLLPFFVVLVSVVAFVRAAVVLIRCKPTKGEMVTPTRVVAVVVILMLSGYWGSYAWKSRDIRTRLDTMRAKVSTMKQVQSLEDLDSLDVYRRLVEYRLGTREWNAMVFHRLADERHGLPYRFPGFLIGVEQTNRYLIGVDDVGKAAVEPDSGMEIQSLLNNRRRTFVSHIVEFQERNRDSLDAESIKTHLVYNLYEDTEYNEAFVRGFKELKKFRDLLKVRLADANGIPAKPDDSAATAVMDATRRASDSYTHILVFCMGWNTDQQESIRNYNSLMGFLLHAAREDRDSRTKAWSGKDTVKSAKPFKPLVIGLSWPSEWSYLKGLSYFTKAGDADETGLVWGSYLLKRVLKPLKEEYRIPLVLVGHSFGARVLSRAVASNPDWIRGAGDDTAYSSKPGLENKDVDLFVGLQGAFSANRFVETGALTSGWMEGSPYFKLKEMGTRFIVTWSKSDAANPMAAFVTGANHVGGKFGGNFCLQDTSTFWSSVYRSNAEAKAAKIKAEEIAAAKDPKDSSKAKVPWPYGEDQYFSPDSGWSEFSKSVNRKIFSIDLSKIVKEQPYDKGGGSHSDIYTPEIGNFLWKSILAFAPGDFKKESSAANKSNPEVRGGLHQIANKDRPH